MPISLTTAQKVKACALQPLHPLANSGGGVRVVRAAVDQGHAVLLNFGNGGVYT